jgi:flavin-dependent dehydrogenase
MGKRADRPMGVAVRRYYTSPRTHDDFLESHVEIWDRSTAGQQPRLLPGYGWIFGMGDGTSNVGLGILSTSPAYGKTDYRTLLRSWLDGTPPEWGFREDNAHGKVAGAALPMSFNRTPHYRGGLLLVGDAGGMVNPFNGEGIAYAMQSARLAAECTVQALARARGPARENALRRYPVALREDLGGYFRLGNVFSRLIGHPAIMRVGVRHALPRATLMRFMLKLLANLYDSREGDAMDRVLTAMTRVTPSV